MKAYSNYIILLLSGLLMFSCRYDREQDRESSTVDTTTFSDEDDQGKEYGPIWSYDAVGDTLALVDSSRGQLAIPDLIQVMNIQYKDMVSIELVEQVQDSVFVRIDSATYLTQQMGSTGARAYMAEVTYTLTEADHIQYVIFDFTEGDHAGPGVYTRESFGKKGNNRLLPQSP